MQDSWHDSYEGAPGDGSAWVKAGGGSCVLRGGSWGGDPLWVRGAARYGFPTHYRHSYGGGHRGFRLARTSLKPLIFLPFYS